MEKTFSRWKEQCLSKLDLSKKGSVDEDVEHVVSLLNSREEYFTTSSCSGRIILIDGVRAASLTGGLGQQPEVLRCLTAVTRGWVSRSCGVSSDVKKHVI